MTHTRTLLAGLLAGMMLLCSMNARAADASQAEIEALRKDVEELRRKLNTVTTPSAKGNVDKVLESKYGPNAAVTTRTGKLTISGLLQVWYYSIQNDNRGLFDDPTINGIPDTNETQDNDSFRIRRAEIKFTMDIHENITGVVMMDPAREATSFPGFPTNQGLFKRANNVSSEFNSNNGPGLGSTGAVSSVQAGSGTINRLLQDAYINFHGAIPHHDVQVGQFKPAFGEEGIRSSAQLDFVERSMVGQLGDSRDLGFQIHGTWWDDRAQYWAYMNNGAGTYFSSGAAQNRSDDNDGKDYGYRALVRPIWGKENKFGQLELGASGSFGKHGESGGNDPINAPVNGLNRKDIWAMRHDFWAMYAAGGPATGLWMRGEYVWIKDRNIPGTVVDLLGSGGTDIGNTGSGSGFGQSNGNPLTLQGFYASMGYKFADSRICDKASWLKNVELLARFESFQNVMTADLVNPQRTDDFATKAWTAGLNYYIKGHDAKIQLNYIWADEPEGDSAGANRSFHNVRNDSFVANFQVAF